MLSNHRRTFLYSLCLLLFLVLLFIGVGRHPPGAAPATTFAPIGRLDESTYRAMDHIRNVVLSGVARALNVIGGGYVTIPLRVALTLWLAFRRRWRGLGAWVLTWVSRVYLNAHWLSDVVAGVLLGTGVALGSAALATEVRDVAMRMRGSPVRAGTPPEARAGTPP